MRNGSVAAQGESRVRFVSVASDAGVDFVHQNGASPEKYLPETMGAGVLFFDYDNNGWVDIFLVNGGSFIDTEASGMATHRLYRNKGDGTFVDATQDSGIVVSGFGMGACAADVDNDGSVDLYVTSMGENKLYRNTGGGRFVDVTRKAGVGSRFWSASCAFGDIDNDGDVDLYVTNYVDFSAENNKFCGYPGQFRAYCHPNVYDGQADVLYRNNGDGTFSDWTRGAGVYRTGGNGLGVVFGDYDDDGFPDIYVANDSVPNFLFHNEGDGRFEEVGFLAGVAVGNTGRPLAGMGTDFGDIDGDALLDIIVTNLNQEMHTLYRNLGAGLFEDRTIQSGIGAETLPFVGFGAVFLDYDNDTDLDIAIANGHVLDNVSMVRDGATYKQVNLLFQNDGSGEFRNVAPEAGPGFGVRKASRGLAAADIDNDGDLDLLIGAIGEQPDLLRNDGGNRENALLVRLQGSSSNRSGIGARLTLTVGEKVLVRTVKAGSSYLSQSDVRVHFGVGKVQGADRLEIKWPSGTVDVVENVRTNQILTVREGSGVTRTTPLARRNP
jgi:hypothetical protein